MGQKPHNRAMKTKVIHKVGTTTMGGYTFYANNYGKHELKTLTHIENQLTFKTKFNSS